GGHAFLEMPAPVAANGGGTLLIRHGMLQSHYRCNRPCSNCDFGCQEQTMNLLPGQARLKAGMTSRANQRNCSMNSAGGSPSAQWTMKSSRPGYLASIDLMPSMT